MTRGRRLANANSRKWTHDFTVHVPVDVGGDFHRSNKYEEQTEEKREPNKNDRLRHDRGVLLGA